MSSGRYHNWLSIQSLPESDPAKARESLLPVCCYIWFSFVFFPQPTHPYTHKHSHILCRHLRTGCWTEEISLVHSMHWHANIWTHQWPDERETIDISSDWTVSSVINIGSRWVTDSAWPGQNRTSFSIIHSTCVPLTIYCVYFRGS